jgi:LysR family transcriptional regulator, regulator for metE and metH
MAPTRPPTAHRPLDSLRPIALELRHLRLVLAIEEERGMTRAGERLHLTQSALSHQLREIETRLGVPLFLRVKKRLVLTEAGHQVAALARRLLPDVVDLEEELRGHASGRRGVLRITTECYTCYDWLPPLLKRFTKQFPDVEVRIVVEATDRPLDALREGGVDLVLTTCPADDKGLESRPLFADEMLMVTAPDHPLAGRRYLVPNDLADARLLLYSPLTESNFGRHFLLPAGVTPREVVQVKLTEAIVSMVKAGLGVSPLAGWAIDREVRRGEVAGVRLGRRGLQRSWVAVSRSGPRLPAYLPAFAELIASQAAPSRFEERRLAAAR